MSTMNLQRNASKNPVQDWKVKLKSVRGFTTTFTTFYDRDIKTYKELREVQILMSLALVGLYGVISTYLKAKILIPTMKSLDK